MCIKYFEGIITCNKNKEGEYKKLHRSKIIFMEFHNYLHLNMISKPSSHLPLS